MPNLFIDEKDEFSVKIAVASAKDNPRDLYCDLTPETLKEEFGEEIDPATIEEHELWFRYPDFGTQTSIFDKSVEVEGNEMRLNLSSVRLHKMISLLKKWTFKDGKGNPMPITADTLRKLHPDVASIIVIQMDKHLDTK